ncbi:LysR family transcriptional regulator [Alteromonas flava]|uniref:LysR family transcriptional regulator n=1 Tax=Alteromonas flava TaxID=2048003 RepID=UPI000C284F4F|nr:LysR family transcriptional regulator [Alteromonas flava]
MQKWDDYRLLLAVHRGRTVRGAAQQLTQNHVTTLRHINRVNNQHPTALIERHAKGLKLTTLGQMMLETAHSIEASIIKGERDISAVGPQYERIVLSLPPPIYEFLLMQPLLDYCAQNPLVKLEISTGYQFANLNENEADIVIRGANSPGDDYVGHRICPIELGFYAHTDYLTHTASERVGWITNTDINAANNYIRQSDFPTAPVLFTIDDLVSRHKLAAQGHGLIIGAAYIAEQFNSLKRCGDQSFNFADLWVLAHQTRINLPRVKHLIGFLRRTLKARAQSINPSG